MLLISILLFLIIKDYICHINKENMIKIPDFGFLKALNITTKYGDINFQFQISTNDKTDHLDAFYITENLKNLNLFSFPNINCTYKLYGKNNNSLIIIFGQEFIDKYNNLIARLFYETKYVFIQIFWRSSSSYK